MADLKVPQLNTVIIAGRLTRDPELKYLPSGSAVCNFSIACSRFWKDKNGEKKEDTTFIDCKAWAKSAEYIAGLKKGRPVLAQGRLESESWEDKASGQKRSRLVIVTESVNTLDWDENGQQRSSQTHYRPTENRYNAPPENDYIPEDDIPF